MKVYILIAIVSTSCIQNKSGQKAVIPKSELTLLDKNFSKYFNIDVNRKYVELNTESKDVHQAYSGYWYPEETENPGTNSFDTLSKYDKAFKTKSLVWEKEKHADKVKDKGHCNGFSAAATRHGEPQKSVEKNGVTFTPEDIKALLAEIYMSTEFETLGGNQCEKSGDPGPLSMRDDKKELGKCEDINPASMHIAYSNALAGENPFPIISELSRDDGVWNYPTIGYRCLNCEDGKWPDKITYEDAASRLGVSSYEFSEEGSLLFPIKMEVTHAQIFRDHEKLGSKETHVVTYDYILEVNQDGDIIGGEWVGESRKNHPDYLWISIGSDRGSGEKEYANPYVDKDQVLAIWRKSVDIFSYEAFRQPTYQNQIGGFEVLINDQKVNSSTSHVSIKVIDHLKDRNFTLSLNSELLRSGIEELDFETQIFPGVNILTINTGDNTYEYPFSGIEL